jgi:hypothetical protein
MAIVFRHSNGRASACRIAHSNKRFQVNQIGKEHPVFFEPQNKIGFVRE